MADNPKVGDRLTVFIERMSNSGNLICRSSPQCQVIQTDQHNPEPHERWMVEVIDSGTSGLFHLKPIKQLDTYPRDAPEPTRGDGANPFK